MSTEISQVSQVVNILKKWGEIVGWKRNEKTMNSDRNNNWMIKFELMRY
jgi:hypothetical protein